MKVELDIDVNYWNKESNYLYDYDSTDSFINQVYVESTGHIIRSISNIDKEVLFIPTSLEKVFNTKNWHYLLNFNISKDYITMNTVKEYQEKPYLTIRHTFKNEESFKSGLKLKEGYILKFGKMSLIVKEIKALSMINNEYNNLNNSRAKEKTICDNLNDENIINNYNSNNQLALNRNNYNNNNVYIRGFPSQQTNMQNNENARNPNTTNSNNNLILKQNKSINNAKSKNINYIKKNTICRFCLCEDNDDDNPLIAPCKCSGTMKYIHFECLKNWLKSKITIKTLHYMVSYSFKALHCELCLNPVPMKFKLKTGIYDLVDMIKPDCSYLVLEQIVKEEQDLNYYLVLFREKTKLKLGRSTDSDVRLNDISISRHHANIIERSDGIYIDDNNSKFGSLLLVDYPVKFILNKSIGVQIGKYYMNMTMKKTFCSLMCCYKPKQLDFVNYNEYMDRYYSNYTYTVNNYDMYITEQNKTISEDSKQSIQDSNRNSAKQTQIIEYKKINSKENNVININVQNTDKKETNIATDNLAKNTNNHNNNALNTINNNEEENKNINNNNNNNNIKIYEEINNDNNAEINIINNEISDLNNISKNNEEDNIQTKKTDKAINLSDPDFKNNSNKKERNLVLPYSPQLLKSNANKNINQEINLIELKNIQENN